MSGKSISRGYHKLPDVVTIGSFTYDIPSLLDGDPHTFSKLQTRPSFWRETATSATAKSQGFATQDCHHRAVDRSV